VSWLFGKPRAAGGLDPLDDRYYDGLPSRAFSAGQDVTPSSAMKASAVYRCVSILANVLAMFPKGMYERVPQGRREAPDHPLDQIISFRPNRRQSAFAFWRQVCYHLVLRQNAYVQIISGPKGRGWVGGLVPLNPDRIRGPEELPDGRLRYVYVLEGGQSVRLTGDVDVWHISGLSSDGLRGLSMLDTASDSIGLALAAERHASRFFERGVKPSGILQHEKTLKPETARDMSASFGNLYGGEQGTGRVPVLWEGMKFVPVSMSLKDAEFLDSRKFSVADIARWFGVPPHMVGDVERSTSWGTGIEQQGLHFLIYSLQPWITLLEQAIRFSLVVQSETFYAKFNASAILRMDSKTQADVFSIMIDKGILNPNECRELLERNPREGGDEYVDVTTPDPTTPPGTAVVSPDPEPADDPEEAPAAAAAPAALVPVLLDAAPIVAKLEADLAAARASSEASHLEQAEIASRAEELARVRAGELLEEERQGLARLATTYARKPAAWEKGARSFYGQLASRAAASLACDREAVKAWCEARRALVMAEGLAGLTEARGEEAADALVALALG
jgi:HK97 family phage portal protein